MTLTRLSCEGDAIPRDLHCDRRFGEAFDAGELSATLITKFQVGSFRPRAV
jgi:hypothetical protein